MRLLWLGALVGLGLWGGCDSPLVARPVTLAELADHTLQFTLADVDSLERDSSLGAYRVTLVFGGSSSCVQLTGDVTATLNGEPMKVAAGGVPDTGVGGRQVCDPPSATYDFDPNQWKGALADIEILLQDGTSSVRLVLHDAKAKRSFMSSPSVSSGTLRRGQEQTFMWQPASDPVPGSISVGLVHKASGVSVTLPVEAPGPTARFLVPEGMVEGDYYLILSGTADAQVGACEGVAGCTGGIFHSEEFNVTVTP